MTRQGYTLIEVIVAMMITSLLASALFSIAISTKTGSIKTDRRLLANQATKTLETVLTAYVTGDATITTPGLCGPNTARRPTPTTCSVQMWNLHTPGVQEDHACTLDAQGVPTVGNAQDVFALTPGGHCLVCTAVGAAESNCFFPPALRNFPANGVLYYMVTGNVLAGTPPQIQVGAWWND